MLLKLPDLREGMALEDFAVFIKDYGIKNISLASEILSKKVG
jgi:PTS system mannose-specific IIA component